MGAACQTSAIVANIVADSGVSLIQVACNGVSDGNGSGGGNGGENGNSNGDGNSNGNGNRR